MVFDIFLEFVIWNLTKLSLHSSRCLVYYAIILNMRKIFFISLIFCFFSGGFFIVQATTKTAKPAEVKQVEVDSDKDGLIDRFEKKLGTDLNKADTDGDGYSDGVEVRSGYDPLDPEPKQISKLIKVDIKTQHLWYYFGDKLMADFPISSGIKGMETPKGEFKILSKILVKDYGGKGYNFYLPDTKWNLHFTTGKYRYYIHGAYWHNKFGQPMSHGCVNVSYQNMEPLYWFAQIGTKVIIN